MTSGVTLARATTSPASTTWPSKSVYTDIPSSPFTAARDAVATRSDPPVRRDDRPLAARRVPDRDARARDGAGHPLAGRILVEVAGLHLEEVNLLAGAGDEPRGAGRVEAIPLASQQRARRVADVVGQHPADEALGARIGRDEGVRLHARESGVAATSVGAASAATETGRAGLASASGRPVPP